MPRLPWKSTTTTVSDVDDLIALYQKPGVYMSMNGPTLDPDPGLTAASIARDVINQYSRYTGYDTQTINTLPRSAGMIADYVPMTYVDGTAYTRPRSPVYDYQYSRWLDPVASFDDPKYRDMNRVSYGATPDPKFCEGQTGPCGEIGEECPTCKRIVI